MSTKQAVISKSKLVDELAQYSSLVQTLLKNRGIASKDEAEKFLNPDYTALADPFLLHDMDKAVDRVLSAVEKDENIVIYADYDADGVPGAVVLYDFFRKIGHERVSVYLPHRHDEGYGFHEAAIRELATNDTNLIITVDVGIVANDAVDVAHDLGIDVIITDHHEPGNTLPQALAVINPKIPARPMEARLRSDQAGGGNYPDKMLCGAAVAYRLVQAIIERGDFDLIPGWEKWLLDMAGIATISDQVPLVNENRIFAYYGLQVLRKSRRPGLRKLFEKTRINQGYLTEDDISFMITPRLNAASRMAHPDDAFVVLANPPGTDMEHAVGHLVQMNDERKMLVAKTMRKVKKTLVKRELREVIVIGNPNWSPGILGLIASKITEEFERPSFVWSCEGDVVKGSCRSNGPASVVVMMQAVSKDVLIQFGGHAGAGGFTARHNQIHFLEDELVLAHKEAVKEGRTDNTGDLAIDETLVLHDVNVVNYNDIAMLAPFGTGNPKPTFRFEAVMVEDVRLFGRGREHLELVVADDSDFGKKAVAFFKKPEDYVPEVKKGVRITLVAQFDLSRFNGTTELRLRIVDIL